MRVEEHVSEVGTLGVSRYEKPGRPVRQARKGAAVPEAGANHA
jgi:hypothetical protein